MITSRLARLKQKETRKLFAVVLAGKMAGVVGAVAAIKGFFWLFESAAGATPLEPVVHQANDLVNPLNTVWTLVAAFLVFFMQAGFMALEAGFARSRETVNIMMECIFDTCLCGLLYFAFGFAFQFGIGNALIGHSHFFLHHAGNDYNYTTTAGAGTGVAFYAFVLFQFAFADTASTV